MMMTLKHLRRTLNIQRMEYASTRVHYSNGCTVRVVTMMP